MDDAALQARKEAASPLSTFRFMDLPKEIRDEIYELAIQPQARFWYTYLRNVDPEYYLPTMLSHDAAGDAGKDTLEQVFPDPNAGRPIGDATAILAFKLFTSTTLLLVSKSVSFEFRTLRSFTTSLPRDHEVFNLHTIVSTCPLLLDICPQSLFELSCCRSDTFFFLGNFPSISDNLLTVLPSQTKAHLAVPITHTEHPHH
ncbi:hypothetical protein K458DRAFT_192659 [Lentithecium fluviatile CBS 122367]|uniref:Uncharacterized protein n=1 Tax=Lentithecium fluviatile CBS 122367 TaxID=1168545 RepID=A0A6G1ID55_9PLEO|nr:hypothetical protein K458DRAFT_192659 [Lentithecium fluviatile CBS 122367]